MNADEAFEALVDLLGPNTSQSVRLRVVEWVLERRREADPEHP